MKFTFNICPGVWQYWFRNKTTKKALTEAVHMGTFHEETKVWFDIPSYITEPHENVEVYVQRIR